MFDLGIESVEPFSEIACYGRLWLVEFRDYRHVIVLEDAEDTRHPQFHYVVEAVEP